jgi:predicted nucleic-acid-binding protein
MTGLDTNILVRYSRTLTFDRKAARLAGFALV